MSAELALTAKIQIQTSKEIQVNLSLNLPPHIPTKGNPSWTGDPQSRNRWGCVAGRGGPWRTHHTCPRSETTPCPQRSKLTNSYEGEKYNLKKKVSIHLWMVPSISVKKKYKWSTCYRLGSMPETFSLTVQFTKLVIRPVHKLQSQLFGGSMQPYWPGPETRTSRFNHCECPTRCPVVSSRVDAGHREMCAVQGDEPRTITSCRTKTYGDRAQVAFCAPRLWNSLQPTSDIVQYVTPSKLYA